MPPPMATGRFAPDDHQARFAAFAGRCAADPFPERKGVAGSDEDPVDMRCGDSRMDGLVFLPSPVHIVRFRPCRRWALLSRDGQWRFRFFTGACRFCETVFQKMLEQVFLHRYSPGQWGHFTKPFSLAVLCYRKNRGRPVCRGYPLAFWPEGDSPRFSGAEGTLFYPGMPSSFAQWYDRTSRSCTIRYD